MDYYFYDIFQVVPSKWTVRFCMPLNILFYGSNCPVIAQWNVKAMTSELRRLIPVPQSLCPRDQLWLSGTIDSGITNDYGYLTEYFYHTQIDDTLQNTCIGNLGKNVSSMTNFSEKLNNLFRKLVPTSSEKLTWKIFREINLHSNSMEQLVSRKYKKVFFIFSTLWFRWGRFHLLSLYAHSTRYNALLSPVPLLLGRNPITMSFFTC